MEMEWPLVTSDVKVGAGEGWGLGLTLGTEIAMREG